MNDHNRRIRIYGELRGYIWMPNCECTKEFDVTFSDNPNEPFTRHWTGLRDALLHITNDGDFQSCAIDWGVVEISYYHNNRRDTRWFDIPVTPKTADCLYQGQEVIKCA